MIDKTTDSQPGNFRQKSDEILDQAHKKNNFSNEKKKIKGNIWYYSVGSGKTPEDKIAFKHPASFPEQLVRDHVYSWTNEGDVVFDPFLGSGTTAKVAYLENRCFCGCDISIEYINDIVVPRLKQCDIPYNVQMAIM